MKLFARATGCRLPTHGHLTSLMLFDVLSYLWYGDTVELVACSVEIASGDSAVPQAINLAYEPISLPKTEVRFIHKVVWIRPK